MARHPTTDASEADLDICFGRILDTYSRARRHDSFSSEHPVWAWFTRAGQVVREVVDATGRKGLTTRWSVGQGRWATVPWIAVMDERETSRVSSGVYVVYLFRGDMTGVYATINQGSSDLLAAYKKDAPERLRERAARIRAKCASTEGLARFDPATAPDFRADTDLARAYEAGAVVHKLYERGKLPDGASLRQDLATLLSAYRQVVPSSRYLC